MTVDNVIRLTNNTSEPMKLLTGHEIKPGGHIDVTRQTVKASGPWLQGEIRRGRIVEGEASAPKPITRTDIHGMAPDDVDELLIMHGCETNGTLTERRERLIYVMFVD